MSNFLPSLGNVYVVGSTQIPRRSATNSDWKNLGPRIGLAYKLGSRTVLRAAYGVLYEAESIPETNLPGANPPFSGSVAFTNNKADFAGAMKVAQGFPTPVTNVYPTAGAVLYAIDPSLRIPYAQQWNAGVQREFSGNMIVSASYVGTKGTSLILQPDINQAFPGAGAVNLRRPFPNFSAINTVESAGSSTFHSLQASAEKRLSKGVSFLLSYTWSHAIDNGDFLAAPQNSQNLAEDRGSGATDVPQRLVGSWTWAAPGRGLALGGWQINGIASIYSGLPFTVTSAVNTLNGTSGSQRANRIGSGVLPASQRSLQEYFDTAAFVTPGLYQFGNSGRDILTGPGTLQFDGSLFKNFHT
jgi:hypothetical protein